MFVTSELSTGWTDFDDYFFPKLVLPVSSHVRVIVVGPWVQMVNNGKGRNEVVK